MTTIEKQIEMTKEALTRLEDEKQRNDNSLFNKTSKIVLESGFSDWSGQTINDIEIKNNSTYYGTSVKISMPIGYATFSLVDDIHRAGLFVTQVTTHSGRLSIIVTDQEGINIMREEEKKL